MNKIIIIIILEKLQVNSKLSAVVNASLTNPAYTLAMLPISTDSSLFKICIEKINYNYLA
jgi:hypothetical protein